MQIEIKKEKDNRLLNRKELLVRIDYEGKSTPSRQEVEAAVSSAKKVDFLKVQVKKILSDHGKPFGTAWVRIYDEPIKEKVESQKESKKTGEEKNKESEKVSEKPKESEQKEGEQKDS